MKNTGECPKCQSPDIMRLSPRGGSPHGHLVPIGLRAVPLVRYVCAACGFTEEWIESRADLVRLREKIGLWRDDPYRPEPGVSIEDQLGLS